MTGSGAGVELGVLRMATASLIVRLWGLARSSRTMRKPQRTVVPSTMPWPSLYMHGVDSKCGTDWVVVVEAQLGRTRASRSETARLVSVAECRARMRLPPRSILFHCLGSSGSGSCTAGLVAIWSGLGAGWV